MKKICLKKLDEVIYTEVLPNGLKVYVWVNKKVNSFKGCYVVRAGSETVSYKIRRKKKTVLFGVAHFLEHMMCKMSDGSSLLNQFNELGCYSNAITFDNRTHYEFMGTTHFKESLNLLLDSLYQKTFSQEAFLNEKGPILEEARMGMDNVKRATLYGINKCLFHTYPNRVSGVGTLEDIRAMTIEDIQDFYDDFYHPKNSFLIVTGNVDPLEVLHTVRENQSKKEFSNFKNPVREKYHEPEKVVLPIHTLFFNVEIPRVYVSLKMKRSLFSYDDITLLDIVNVLLAANFGVTSFFREELLAEHLAVSLGFSAYIEEDYLIVQVSARTKYVDDCLPLLKERLFHLKFEERDIQRKIKSEIANLVLSYEDPDTVCDIIAYSVSKYKKIIDNEKIILENITMEDVLEVLNTFSMKECNLFILRPKKEDEC